MTHLHDDPSFTVDDHQSVCPSCDHQGYYVGFACSNCGYIEDRQEDQMDYPWNEPGAPFVNGNY